MRSKAPFYAFAAVAIATAHLGAVPSAHAGAYPVNQCVADKLKAASASCKAELAAWSKYVGGGGTDTGTRDAALTAASGKLGAAWTKAEDKSTAKGVDCADTTLSVGDMQALVDGAVSALVTNVTTGLTLSNGDDAKCGAALLKDASSNCAAILKAESGYIQKLAAGKTKRNAAITKANDKFASKAGGTLASCPSGATVVSMRSTIDGFDSDAVAKTTISPNLDDTRFTTITPGGSRPHDTPLVQSYLGDTITPVCAFGTPYNFFVKRGTVNKVVMYYQGGGACWDYNTCKGIGTFDNASGSDTCQGGTNNGEVCDTISDCPDQTGTCSSGSSCTGGTNHGEPCSTIADCPDHNGLCAGSDNPNHFNSGFGDLTNPNNPFKDWNIVFVSYCTGDIHFGDHQITYFGPMHAAANTQHFGWHNARAAEKFAREHFVNPDEIFVTGSSAGAYGAFFNAPLHEDVWPDSKFSVLADAGNGVITNDFLTNNFPTWQFDKHLPAKIPGLKDTLTNGTGIPGYTKVVADFFPNTMWAHYATAYDGSTGGQTGFYNVMVHIHDAITTWLSWWTESCAWNGLMEQQATDTYNAIHTAPSHDNYRYYIGRGSRHTMYGSDTVAYNDDAIGGTPNMAGWINQMRNRDPGWTNQHCGDCETILPGDPKPNPLQEPFEQQGSDVVINCP